MHTSRQLQACMNEQYPFCVCTRASSRPWLRLRRPRVPSVRFRVQAGEHRSGRVAGHAVRRPSLHVGLPRVQGVQGNPQATATPTLTRPKHTLVRMYIHAVETSRHACFFGKFASRPTRGQKPTKTTADSATSRVYRYPVGRVCVYDLFFSVSVCLFVHSPVRHLCCARRTKSFRITID